MCLSCTAQRCRPCPQKLYDFQPLYSQLQENVSKIAKEFCLFSFFAPTIRKPPRPTNTRSTTWLETCQYYAEHLKIIHAEHLEIIHSFLNPTKGKGSRI